MAKQRKSKKLAALARKGRLLSIRKPSSLDGGFFVWGRIVKYGLHVGGGVFIKAHRRCHSGARDDAKPGRKLGIPFGFGIKENVISAFPLRP